MTEKRLVIDFQKYEQMKVFMEWFKNFGFDEFINSDFVHDNLSAKNFPKKLKKWEKLDVKNTMLI